MITDVKNTFTAGVASTGASAAIGDIIDLGAEVNLGKGNPVQAKLVLTEAYVTGTSQEFSIQSSAAVGGPYVVNATTGAVVTASLTKGAEFTLMLPHDCKRFLRLNRVAVGTVPTAGSVAAWIAPR